MSGQGSGFVHEEVVNRGEPNARSEWLKQRQTGIGGSDVAAIVGKDPYGRTAADVYDEKIGEVVDGEPSPAMLRGRYLEPVAVQLYQELTGRALRRQPMRRHREFPFMIANVDRQILANSDDRGTGILEVKCPGVAMFAKMKAHGLHEGLSLQLQHYLTVLGYQWGSFALFNAERWALIHFDVEVDPAWSEVLVEKEAAFWRKVENRERPVVEEVSNLPAIPEVKGEVVLRNDEQWAVTVTGLVEANALRRTADEIYEVAKDQVKELVGGYAIIEGGGVRVHYSQRPGRKTFDRKALERAGPLDPTTVALVLGDYENGGEIAEALHERARLDLSQFEKIGKPYDDFRSYILKAERGEE
jgi:putative phage-type endonuclease